MISMTNIFIIWADAKVSNPKNGLVKITYRWAIMITVLIPILGMDVEFGFVFPNKQ